MNASPKISPLTTQRLRLVAATRELVCLEMDSRAAFFAALGVAAPPAWPPPLNDETTIAFFRRRLEERAEDAGWWIWYMLERLPGGGERLAGSIGFKGPPTETGDVEVGYSVLEPLQRQGFAVEALQALIGWAAMQGGVKRILAHAMPEGRASQAVLYRSGFRLVGKGFEEGAYLFERPVRAGTGAGPRPVEAARPAR